MVNDAGNRMKRATKVSFNGGSKTISEQIGGSDRSDYFQLEFGPRSSSIQADLSTTGGRARMDLFSDRNQNGRIDRGEQIAKSTRRSAGEETLSVSNLDSSEAYYLRIKPRGNGTIDYQLSLTDGSEGATASALSDRGSGRLGRSSKWNASFLNRSKSNLQNYQSYNFNRPDATMDLGDRGTSGRTVAELDINFGRRRPTSGVEKNRFAMEAWTTVTLEAGEFYRISSDSDDGTRFMFTDPSTGKIAGELSGDWRRRTTRAPEWTQVITPTRTGEYNFVVQYFDHKGKSVVDVVLEEIDLQAQIKDSALNLRNTPSTVSNTPIGAVNIGDIVTINRQVPSTNDSVYRNWYEVVTVNGTKGYITADDRFVSVFSDATVSDIVSLATDGVLPPAPPTTPGDGGTPPTPPPNPNPGFSKGVISSKVWITSDDKIAFRNNKDISGAELGRLPAGTPLTLIGKEVGGRYLNGFDSWYKVQVNGQEGYVASYYVDVLDDGGLYETAISKDNPLYKPHLNEAENPTYYSQSYRPFIESAATRYSWLQPSVIAGIGSRESAWGRILSPAGPSGTGDGGHGRGLMQIDDRFHAPFINTGAWRDPKASIDYGIDKVLAPNYNYLDQNTALEGIDLLRGALASYNAGLSSVTRALAEGRDVDYYTTGQDYSWDVLNRAGFFQLNGWA
ncbi:MAG: SH3 domain-containing protein [Synechococcales bacterium]|nr:SH3 domain-containing protein [Synechococcales bacterium]